MLGDLLLRSLTVDVDLGKLTLVNRRSSGRESEETTNKWRTDLPVSALLAGRGDLVGIGIEPREAGYLDTTRLSCVVDLGYIPNWLDAAELEQYLREHGAGSQTQQFS